MCVFKCLGKLFVHIHTCSQLTHWENKTVEGDAGGENRREMCEQCELEKDEEMRWRWRHKACGDHQTVQHVGCKLALFRLLDCRNDLLKFWDSLNGGQKSEWKFVMKLADLLLQVFIYFYSELHCSCVDR